MTGSSSPKKRETPWAIRGVSLEGRNAAIAAARRSNATLGEWLDRAVRQQVKAEQEQARAVGPTIEETLAKLAESMAQQAEATRQQMEQAQQQNAAIAARLEAVEQRERPAAMNGGGNLLGRIHGLLWRPEAPSNMTKRAG